MDERMKDSVLSTRVRLARNFRGYAFPRKIGKAQAEIVEKKVRLAMGNDYKAYSIASLGEAESGVLMEKHLVSKELIRSRYGSVIVNDSETAGIMVNEEDHIRIQVILRGLALEEAYARADGIDERIAEKGEYAFDEELGFLTACPTNLGTGMRASVMMFLPALTITDTLMKSIKTLGMMNITVRGVYGEGSKADGFVYQISNQRTLGMTEKDILQLVNASVNHLADTEQRARDFLMSTRKTEITDEIMRAYGIATNAYRLTAKEFTNFNALIKLGVYYGLIPISRVSDLDDLATSLQPYTLNALLPNRARTEEEMDVFRAKMVRETLLGIIGK